MSIAVAAPSRARRAASATLAMLLTAACTSTSLVNMWRDPAYPRQPLHSILVVTLRKDPATRRVWEDDFVAALKSAGVSATASYSIFPDAAPDTAALTASVRRRGFDAVLVAHQLPTNTETRYVPGYLSNEPVTFLSPWTGHYFTYFTDVYSPGYRETDRIVRYETEVFMTGGAGRLIWSGATESLNPSSATQVHQEITKVIVPALVKSGVMQTH